jgi:hypothetical protein
MGAEYYLKVIDTAGVTQAVITDYLGLAYVAKVNEPGILRFTLAETNGAIANIVHNAQVEVWRRNADIGLDWYRDFVGIIRALSWSTRNGLTTIEAQAPGIMHVLSWRTVAYKAGTSNRSDFAAVNAERVMKNLVTYNATAAGTTADGRIVLATDGSGLVSGLYTIAVQADGNTGNAVSIGCAWRNVLTALQDVASVAGGDFSMVKTAATTFEFRWYAGQLGTDRSATQIFALDRGNMADPKLELGRVTEATLAIVAGQGEGSARAATTRQGTDYSATRNIEVFVDARNSATTAALNTAGDVVLDEDRARPEFSFDVLQVPNAYYGVHYFLGDKVTARYRGTSYTQKVQGVTVEFAPSGDERIQVELRNV